MQQYKGYYIDHVYFNSKGEIDQYDKDKDIEQYKSAIRYYYPHATVEASIYCAMLAARLHEMYDISYSDLEHIEIKAYD